VYDLFLKGFMAFFIGNVEVINSAGEVPAFGLGDNLAFFVENYPASFIATDGKTAYTDSWTMNDTAYGRYILNKCKVFAGTNCTSVTVNFAMVINANCQLVICNG